MSNNQIILDFGDFKLEAKLLDSPIAIKFVSQLPYAVHLQQWGDEVYGSIDTDLGEHDPKPNIPPGGIAYTNNGNYVCIFFGQTPAWPVEYIGQIDDDSWKKLLTHPNINQVTISNK